MKSGYDLPGLFQFLSQTPEQGLRKMLVDGKPMTDVHFAMMLKIIRAGSEADFCGYAADKTFPKIKFSPNEIKLKDKFWDECFTTFQSRGVLNPATATNAA